MYTSFHIGLYRDTSVSHLSTSRADKKNLIWNAIILKTNLGPLDTGDCGKAFYDHARCQRARVHSITDSFLLNMIQSTSMRIGTTNKVQQKSAPCHHNTVWWRNSSAFSPPLPRHFFAPPRSLWSRRHVTSIRPPPLPPVRRWTTVRAPRIASSDLLIAMECHSCSPLQHHLCFYPFHTSNAAGSRLHNPCVKVEGFIFIYSLFFSSFRSSRLLRQT